MTLEKQTFTCDQTGEKFKRISKIEGDVTGTVITPIEKPKVFPWDEVADGVLVKDNNNTHCLFNHVNESTFQLRLSDKWQVWMGGEQPLPDNTDIQVEQRCGELQSGRSWNFEWKHSNKSSIDIIAFKVLSIGDYKYPDEV